MYEIILAVQYLSLVAILAGLYATFISKKSEFQSVVMLVFASNLITQFGYIFEVSSKNLQSALFGTRLQYYGKLCVIFFMMYFTFKYCDCVLPPLLAFVLNMIHVGILVAVWTCDRHTLYYSSIEFVEDGWYPHLVVTHGPLHYIFDLLLAGYMIAIFVLCVRKLATSKSGIERKRLICLLVMPIIIAISYAVYLLGWTGIYDSTSAAVLIDTLIMLFALRKLEIINYLARAKEEIIDVIPDGIIVLDEKKHLVYNNIHADELFPEIRDGNSSRIVEKIDSCFDTSEEIWLNEKLYSIRKKDITEEGRVKSSIYTLTDNTSDYVLTYIDGLTNVQNRRALIRKMEHVAPEENQWLVIIDIDSFKSINDTKGHQVGDDCLILFAATLVEMFTKEAVYRYGGDEFVVIVNETAEELEKKLIRVNETLSAETNTVPFHVSGGYIQLEAGAELEALMKKADDALYVVKKSGKGRFARA